MTVGAAATWGGGRARGRVEYFARGRGFRGAYSGAAGVAGAEAAAGSSAATGSLSTAWRRGQGPAGGGGGPRPRNASETRSEGSEYEEIPKRRRQRGSETGSETHESASDVAHSDKEAAPAPLAPQPAKGGAAPGAQPLCPALPTRSRPALGAGRPRRRIFTPAACPPGVARRGAPPGPAPGAPRPSPHPGRSRSGRWCRIRLARRRWRRGPGLPAPEDLAGLQAPPKQPGPPPNGTVDRSFERPPRRRRHGRSQQQDKPPRFRRLKQERDNAARLNRGAAGWAGGPGAPAAPHPGEGNDLPARGRRQVARPVQPELGPGQRGVGDGLGEQRLHRAPGRRAGREGARGPPTPSLPEGGRRPSLGGRGAGADLTLAQRKEMFQTELLQPAARHGPAEPAPQPRARQRGQGRGPRGAQRRARGQEAWPSPRNRRSAPAEERPPGLSLPPGPTTSAVYRLDHVVPSDPAGIQQALAELSSRHGAHAKQSPPGTAPASGPTPPAPFPAHPGGYSRGASVPGQDPAAAVGRQGPGDVPGVNGFLPRRRDRPHKQEDPLGYSHSPGFPSPSRTPPAPTWASAAGAAPPRGWRPTSGAGCNPVPPGKPTGPDLWSPGWTRLNAFEDVVSTEPIGQRGGSQQRLPVSSASCSQRSSPDGGLKATPEPGVGARRAPLGPRGQHPRSRAGGQHPKTPALTRTRAGQQPPGCSPGPSWPRPHRDGAFPASRDGQGEQWGPLAQSRASDPQPWPPIQFGASDKDTDLGLLVSEGSKPGKEPPAPGLTEGLAAVSGSGSCSRPQTQHGPPARAPGGPASPDPWPLGPAACAPGLPAEPSAFSAGAQPPRGVPAQQHRQLPPGDPFRAISEGIPALVPAAWPGPALPGGPRPARLGPALGGGPQGPVRGVLGPAGGRAASCRPRGCSTRQPPPSSTAPLLRQPAGPRAAPAPGAAGAEPPLGFLRGLPAAGQPEQLPSGPGPRPADAAAHGGFAAAPCGELRLPAAGGASSPPTPAPGARHPGPAAPGAAGWAPGPLGRPRLPHGMGRTELHPMELKPFPEYRKLSNPGGRAPAVGQVSRSGGACVGPFGSRLRAPGSSYAGVSRSQRPDGGPPVSQSDVLCWTPRPWERHPPAHEGPPTRRPPNQSDKQDPGLTHQR
ncbi:unnamed protein product [Lepidochelys kempii]